MATRYETQLVDISDLHDRRLIELALNNVSDDGYRVAGVLYLEPEVFVIMEREVPPGALGGAND